MKSLQTFYQDIETRENVKNYLIECLEQMALKRIFAKQDVSGIADAKDCIEKAFDELDILFGEKPKAKEPINEAR